MTDRVPRRVLRCTTHHYACECREYKFKEMETALKIIHTWASCYDRNIETPEEAMLSIVNKCKAALSTTSEPS